MKSLNSVEYCSKKFSSEKRELLVTVEYFLSYSYQKLY